MHKNGPTISNGPAKQEQLVEVDMPETSRDDQHKEHDAATHKAEPHEDTGGSAEKDAVTQRRGRARLQGKQAPKGSKPGDKDSPPGKNHKEEEKQPGPRPQRGGQPKSKSAPKQEKWEVSLKPSLRPSRRSRS